jgi:hypothetical protein
MWKVRVHYTTGDSFGSENRFAVFEDFISEDEAIVAKTYIEEHYKYANEHYDARSADRKVLDKQICSKPWFVYSNAYNNNRKEQLKYFYWSIALKVSNMWITQSVDWYGYFESIVEVEVYEQDHELDWEHWSNYDHS